MPYEYPLYIFVGVVISIFIGAPLYWCQSRDRRRRVEAIEDEEQELRNLREYPRRLQRLEREIRQMRQDRERLNTERNTMSAQIAQQQTQLAGYRDCQNDLARANARVTGLEDEIAAANQDRERVVRDVEAAAERQIMEAHENFRNMEQRYEFVNQQYRDLLNRSPEPQ